MINVFEFPKVRILADSRGLEHFYLYFIQGLEITLESELFFQFKL
jgi:hypothetical protein